MTEPEVATKDSSTTKKAVADNNDDDDEEEEDEDYNPAEDREAEGDDDDDDALMQDAADDAATANHLSTIQQKQVDEAFEKLFGYKWGTSFRLTRDASKWTPQERLLCRILGPTAAATLLQSRPGKRKAHLLPHRKQQTNKYKVEHRKQQQQPAQTATPAETPAPQPAAAAAAGSAKAAPAARAGGGGGGGVDQLLKQLAAPNKISTVAKTSADWDHFKDETGLGEKLEEQADSKNAYLKRQDFLNRVDHRKFELEKKERDRNRVKRG